MQNLPQISKERKLCPAYMPCKAAVITMNKQYKISVPIMNHSFDSDAHRAEFLEMIRACGVSRVFLVMERYLSDSPARAAALELLRTNVAYLRENGVAEIGAWYTGMGHGGALDHEGALESTDCPRLVGFGGGICDDTFCVADEGYRAIMSDYAARVAACGVDIIQLDDDLRLGYRGNGLGCTCDYHMTEFARRTGREWTREALYQAVYSGAPNAIRDAWFDLMAEGFYGYGSAMRTAIDRVNPAVRFGFCAAPTSFDPDCVDCVKLIRTFCGNTKPYLRGIGAAYWGNNDAAVEDVISMQRMERAWMMRDPDIEFFTEGDVYPRPRYRLPAWLLEAYDTALRADGSMDGILKYMFDYVQTPTYETGYVTRHKKHAPLYAEIEHVFEGGMTRGVYVYEAEQKLRHVTLPTPAPGEWSIMTSSQPASAKILNRLCIPTSFVPNGDAVTVMGLSAQLIPTALLRNGVILDMEAARALTERGIDCGLRDESVVPAPGVEQFPATEEREAEALRTLTNGTFYHAVLDARAEVLSTFDAADASDPAAWLYENADGQRFFVFAFDAASVDVNSQLICSYARQAQFIRALAWVQGKQSAAVCQHHPHLYQIVKDKDDGTRAIGLWNCFADEMLTPVVELDQPIASVSFLGDADGYADGSRIVFVTDIPAHAFAGVIVTFA